MRQQRFSYFLLLFLLLILGDHGGVWATDAAPAPLGAVSAPTLKPDNSHFDLNFEQAAGVLKALGKEADIFKYQAKVIVTPLVSRHVVYVLDHMDEEFLPGITLLYDPSEKKILGAFVRDVRAPTSRKPMHLFNVMMANENPGVLDESKALQVALFYMAFVGQPTDLVTEPAKVGPKAVSTKAGYRISFSTKAGAGTKAWTVSVSSRGCIVAIKSP